MPNRLTRVPPRPVPSLPAAARVLLPIADAFMLLMLSRPATGSLRVTWVTPATLWMCALLAVGGVCGGVVAFVVGGGVAWVVAGFVLLALAVGGAAVAVVGALQRFYDTSDG
jgi:hypothetical protein